MGEAGLTQSRSFLSPELPKLAGIHVTEQTTYWEDRLELSNSFRSSGLAEVMQVSTATDFMQIVAFRVIGGMPGIRA
jgi:hypothetical protein